MPVALQGIKKQAQVIVPTTHQVAQVVMDVINTLVHPVMKTPAVNAKKQILEANVHTTVTVKNGVNMIADDFRNKMSAKALRVVVNFMKAIAIHVAFEVVLMLVVTVIV